MSEIGYILKNKNKYAKEEKERRSRNELELREEGLFRVDLRQLLETIKNIFLDSDIDSLTVSIHDKFINKFTTALYSEEFSEFDWEQIDSNVYKLSLKEIQI